MTTASSGVYPCCSRERGDVGGDRRPDVRGDRPAPQEAGARRRRGSVTAHRPARGRVAELPALDVRPGRLRELLDLGEERLDAAAHLVGQHLVAEGRQVDHDVLGRAVGGGLGQARRDGEVARGVEVAATGEALGPATTSRQASSVRSGTSAATRADARIAAVAGRLLVVRLARQLQGGGERRVGIRVLVGEHEEPRRPARVRPPRGGRGSRRTPRTSGDRPRATRPSPRAPRRTRRPPRRPRRRPGWGWPIRGAR